jgi:hypothetical protein
MSRARNFVLGFASRADDDYGRLPRPLKTLEDSPTIDKWKADVE